MVSTYTEILRLNRQGDNENPDTWGEILNEEVIDLIEEAVAGNPNGSLIDIDGATTDVTLEILDGEPSDTDPTGTNKARCGILRTEGAPGSSITINLPTRQKWYLINCQHTGISVNFSHSGTTTVVEGNPGDLLFIMTDATEIYLITKSQSGATTGDFLEKVENLDDLPNKPLAINNLGVYPVGSVYISTNNTDPSLLFGGVWQAIGQGRCLIGAGTSSADEEGESRVFAAGATGGSFGVTLTEPQLPSHTHTETRYSFTTGDANGGIGIRFASAQTVSTGSAGGDEAHNNLQPYLAVYIWERLS